MTPHPWTGRETKTNVCLRQLLIPNATICHLPTGTITKLSECLKFEETFEKLGRLNPCFQTETPKLLGLNEATTDN